MNYKKTLFFIAKCLTITHEVENKKNVEEILKSSKVNWDNIVKVSTAHFVFPALYCNLKRADFLQYLPNDLVEYMEHITDLNRKRNEQIISEAKELNALLLANNITPIFLKGTGNLLEGLYEDIGERMVGDVDLLTSKNDFNLAVNILKANDYTKKENSIDNTVVNRHFPKLTKKGKIAAIEVHYKMISQEKNFNFNTVKDNFKNIEKNINVLSYKDQILMTCYNKQFNDRGQWYKNISLRNSYDLFLLSKKASPKKTLEQVNSKENKYLINFLASTNMVFSNPKSLEYTITKMTETYKTKLLLFTNQPKKRAYNKKKWDLFFLISNRLNVLIKSFYLKEYREFLFHKFFNPKPNL